MLVRGEKVGTLARQTDSRTLGEVPPSPQERHYRRAAKQLQLSRQQTRTVLHACRGVPWGAIARKLEVSKSSVEQHLKRAQRKVGAADTRTLVEAVHNEAWRQLLQEMRDGDPGSYGLGGSR